MDINCEILNDMNDIKKEMIELNDMIDKNVQKYIIKMMIMKIKF